MEEEEEPAAAGEEERDEAVEEATKHAAAWLSHPIAVAAAETPLDEARQTCKLLLFIFIFIIDSIESDFVIL